MVWHFIGVYIINRTLHDRLEIRNFSSRVEKYFTRSLRSLVKYFSTLEEKFRISARPCNILYLLYRQECFTGKYTARKIHMKLHPGPEWRIFHILTSEDIGDVISRSFTVVCANSRWKMASDRFVYIIKRKLHGGLKIWILFSRVKNNILLTRCARS